jgi:hypothetical protein
MVENNDELPIINDEFACHVSSSAKVISAFFKKERFLPNSGQP